MGFKHICFLVLNGLREKLDFSFDVGLLLSKDEPGTSTISSEAKLMVVFSEITIEIKIFCKITVDI
jgi:hypothetical protein